MTKEYVKFGIEWRKRLMGMSKESLEGLFKVEPNLHLTKERLINAIRTKLIVDDFNEHHPVGSTVYWRSMAVESSEYKKMTVQTSAYDHHGMPVCFFKEKSGFCSVEPQFMEG